MNKINLRQGEIEQGVLLINATGRKAFRAVLEKYQSESSLRVVVVKLAGAAEIRQTDQPLGAVTGDLKVPIIACASGLIRGWELDVVLGAHLCFTTDSCRFEFNGSADMKEKIGKNEIAVKQTVISAKEMLDLGEINEVFPPADLMAHAETTALCISKMAPLAVSACLRAVAESKKSTLNQGLTIEASLFAELFDSQDMRRGTAAFLEKTKPVFEGN